MHCRAGRGLARGVQIQQVTDRFVNMYLIRDPAGLSLVDADTPNGLWVLERALRQRGERLADLRHILITHADPDHMGSAAALCTAMGAARYTSRIEAEAMARGAPSREPQENWLITTSYAIMSWLMNVQPAQATAIVSLGDALSILGGLHVLTTPGHTAGHLSFFAPAYGMLFAGDSLLATRRGLHFADGPVTLDYATGWASAQLQAQLQPRIVCAGHGPVLQADHFPRVRLHFGNSGPYRCSSLPPYSGGFINRADDKRGWQATPGAYGERAYWSAKAWPISARIPARKILSG
ncbi:MBL fold metallo-hydrolase [Candidatus Gracilibacteria bacterium]|nr:MBL fold metallo-hydrolase [Candidatus Gracilibacteria bacterium]